MKKDLISIANLKLREVEEIFNLTDKLKKDKTKFAKALCGKTLALVFQKPSNRTRVSFEVGMYQLGGYSIYLGPDEINLGVRESIKDVAKTLSRYVNVIVLRTFAHNNILEMAKYATVPVINGLSDFSHPCQALADIYTIKEKLKHLKGLTLAYVGDGNNVCNSLLYACAKVGMNMNVATPKGYEPEGKVINLFHKPEDAVKNADIIYTDVWASMGQEKEVAKRKKIFQNFQVNKKLVNLAKKNCLIMHCLPAHRGEEITDEIIESKNSVIFDQAENRMHVQKAILITLLR
ncbi:MAG: ornithine carbamoyltransferase [Omnitrophica WOR_2 bacterium RBG_13_41_10]|nr:MAG: ornithine carbamoyltransferase [Omnitrophica WOR_2 bacterium RBG_13_41_10]